MLLVFGKVKVVHRVVDVVSHPGAIVFVTGQRANDAVKTLIHIDFKVRLNFADLHEPLCALAEISIINDVITHVIISCHLGAPDVKKQFDFQVPKI